MPLPPVMRHIDYAEQWLRWARHDFRRGDGRGVVLRLLLAEAEIRHAREVGMRLSDTSRAPSRGKRLRAAALGSAAMLLLALAYPALHGRLDTRQVSMDSGVHIAPGVRVVQGSLGPVQLQSGNLLVLVPPTDAAPREAPRPFGSWELRTVQEGLPRDGVPWTGGGVTNATLRDQQTSGGSF